MWEKFAVHILRRRQIVSIALLILSFLLAYFSTKVEIAYDNPKFIPDSDPDQINYVEFRKTFGDDGKISGFSDWMDVNGMNVQIEQYLETSKN